MGYDNDWKKEFDPSSGKLRSKRGLLPVRPDDLFDVLVAIVNTAQLNPDRCMADVCNDNFAVRGINMRAEMTDDEDNPVRIEKTSNSALGRNDPPNADKAQQGGKTAR